MKRSVNLFAALLSFIIPSAIQAQVLLEDTNDSIKNFNTFTVSRSSVHGHVPGALSVITSEQLRISQPVSGNEVFRKAAGLHVVDEEGAGLRVNIGVRGLDPDRSRNVLMLEDGIPVALNPYGEPEMYYTPAIDRMSGVEILKGSGQIQYGPQTIGGVINYRTADPTKTMSLKARMSYGSGGFNVASMSYSNTFGNVGMVATLLRKSANKLGYAQFDLMDFTSKFVIEMNKRNHMIIKFGVYDELSNSTYIGLTQTMYQKADNDFVLMAPDDKLDVRRYSASATHKLEINKRLSLSSTVYGYTVTRNWQRQDFSSSKSTSNQTGVVWGDTNVANGAIYMRNQNAHRNRQFEVLAAESKLKYQFNVFNAKNNLTFGARYLIERAYEQRLNGKKADAQSGDLVEDEIRTGKAFSAFAQNQTQLGERWTMNVGLRLEDYNYERNILRNTFVINSVSKVVDTNLVTNRQIMELIPGFGLNYKINANNTLFTGVHKGFAPPRIKDAISNSGQAYAIDAERSLNTELGLRGKLNAVLDYELTAFRMDFKNQIIPVSESSGAAGAGLVNGGETIHQGFESWFNLKLDALLKLKYKLSVNAAYTYVDARINSDRFIKSGTETINIIGNKTPYAPKSFLNFGLNAQFKNGLGFQFSGNRIGEQYTDLLNTELPSADGRIGWIQSYSVFDANVYYTIKKINLDVNFAVKNLSNERYIVSRRPQGIRVGLPRTFVLGLYFNLQK